MDKNMLDVMVPSAKMNDVLCSGIAYHQLQHAEAYIHSRFRSSSIDYPPGLKYVGPVMCSPEEQFTELIKKYRGIYNINKSDVKLSKFRFTYEDKFLRDIYILLPCPRRGGVIYLNGTLYKCTPVLSGKVFNIEKSTIFMPIPRDRSLSFSSSNKTSDGSFTIPCVRDGKVYTGVGIWSHLHHFSDKASRSPLYPCILNYILAEFGLTETLRRFALTGIKIGMSELDGLDETWHVYRSCQLSGTVASRKPVTHIRVAIPRSCRLNDDGHVRHEVDSIMATLFYIIEQFPALVTIDDIEDPQQWLLLLDRFIFKVPSWEKQQFRHITIHHNSVKTHFDNTVKIMLENDGIYCNSMLEVFRYIIMNFQMLIIHENSGSMYNKELSIIQYLLFNIVSSINTFGFKVKQMAGNQLTDKKIIKAMNKYIKVYEIFLVEGHGELSSGNIATDFMPFNATCNMVSRAKQASGGKSQKKQKVISDPMILLHPSQVEVATCTMATGSSPEARGKANPFMYLSPEYMILPRAELEKEISDLEWLLTSN